jgi:hypothetical protein
MFPHGLNIITPQLHVVSHRTLPEFRITEFVKHRTDKCGHSNIRVPLLVEMTIFYSAPGDTREGHL